VDGRYGWEWDRYDDDWVYDGEAPRHRRDYADRGPPPGYDGPPPGYDGPPPPRGYDGPPPPPRYHHAPPPAGACGNPCVRTYVMHGGPGAPPPPHGYGYGCGCGPVVVTETTVTTAPVVEMRTYTTYETRWVKARPKPRKVYRPAPPPPGERG
jgi:hypothetical protein